MTYSGKFPKYVSAAEKREKAQKSIEELKKKNPNILPVILEGKKIANTWWGEAWNKNLESYSDYSSRIVRGRSYVRSGAVLDLEISKGNITSVVQGSSTKPYKIEINIEPLSKELWETIIKDCAGKIASLQELIEGKFPKVLSELFTAQGKGLFPSPKEIKFKCSCPDAANMCKHVASALYGVGARLDVNPVLFFELRNINIDELISIAVSKESSKLLEKSKVRSSRVIEKEDVSEMFGIQMEMGTETDIEKKQ
jgi:uncharacterized Zn finger protein